MGDEKGGQGGVCGGVLVSLAAPRPCCVLFWDLQTALPPKGSGAGSPLWSLVPQVGHDFLELQLEGTLEIIQFQPLTMDRHTFH